MPAVRTRPTRQDTGNRLLDGALAAFAERGFHGTRVEDICARAGLTRGAFYSSFTTKDEVFLALYDRVIAQIEEILDRGLTAAAADKSDPLTTFFKAISQDRVLGQEWYLLNTEFTLYAIRQPATASALAAHRVELRAVIIDRLGRLLALAGQVFAGDPELLARAVIAISDGGMAQHLVEPDAIAPTELTTALLPSILATYSQPAEVTC